jgi:hypothetical protein
MLKGLLRKNGDSGHVYDGLLTVREREVVRELAFGMRTRQDRGEARRHHQDGRNASQQHHAKPRSPFGQRIGLVRGPYRIVALGEMSDGGANGAGPKSPSGRLMPSSNVPSPSDEDDMKLICSRCGQEMTVEDSSVPFEFEPVDTLPVCDRCRYAERLQPPPGSHNQGAAA